MLVLAFQDYYPKTVLDVCCGTGTMCEILSEEGLQLSGFDISSGMIERARAKAAKAKLDIPYFVADATNFDLGRTFDAAFSFFDSLNNIVEPAKFQAALKCVANHLEPGGSFVFDLNTAYAFEQKMFDQKNLRSNARLRYNWEGHYDPETKIIRVEMQFWHHDEEFREVHIQRAYSDEEVREMLRKAGFVKIHAFNAYTLSPIRPKSDRVHYACRKGK